VCIRSPLHQRLAQAAAEDAAAEQQTFVYRGR
jgi:hypothetical protein